MFATTPVVPIAVSEVAKVLPQGRRRINFERGRALEKLSHAIEYLMDEHVYEAGSPRASGDRLPSVELLKDLRNQVYFEAPEIPPFSRRCRLLLADFLS